MIWRIILHLYRKYRGFISLLNTLSTNGSAVAELLIVIE